MRCLNLELVAPYVQKVAVNITITRQLRQRDWQNGQAVLHVRPHETIFVYEKTA